MYGGPSWQMFSVSYKYSNANKCEEHILLHAIPRMDALLDTYELERTHMDAGTSHITLIDKTTLLPGN